MKSFYHRIKKKKFGYIQFVIFYGFFFLMSRGIIHIEKLLSLIFSESLTFAKKRLTILKCLKCRILIVLSV